MATMVRYLGLNNNLSHVFISLTYRDILTIKSFKGGIATIKFNSAWSNIYEIAEIVAGCFSKYSNFSSMLFDKLDYPENTILKGIEIVFEGVNLLVTNTNADRDKILKEWYEEFKILYKNSEFLANRVRKLKLEEKRKKREKDILEVYETTEFEFKDLAAKNEWNEYYNTNAVNKFRKYTIKYVLVWAKYMQHIMSKHNKNVAEIANETSYVCDIDGVTIDMYAYAILLLSKYWKYGEELRRWHNSKYGVEDEENVISFVCTIKT